jgi:ankyrin repeat domain-containing protein 50
MRKRDRFLVLLGSNRGRSATPILQTASNGQAANIIVSSDTGPPLDTPGKVATARSGNCALELAIVRHLAVLPEVERDAFREAANSLTDENVLDHVKAYDAQHKETSHHRSHAEALARFLGLLNRFMAGITIFIQSNPNVSALVVGGVRLVIDVAVNFIEFSPKLSDMFCRFADFLAPLTEYAKASEHEDLVLEALASVYGDLLRFCKQAHDVFIDQGALRKWVSWRTFWRLISIPFEEDFGRIESDLRHHLKVLGHSAQALGLNVTLNGSRPQRERERSLSFYSSTANFLLH